MWSSKWVNSAEADRVLNMWNWIAQKPCATPRGARTNRPLKCGNLQYKWIVLIWWAECCTLAETSHCEILFVTLCSLSLTPEPTPSNTSSSSPCVVFISSLHPLLLLPASYLSRVSASHFIRPVFSLSSSSVRSLKRNRQRLGGEAAGGAEMCPASSSDLLPAPTFSSLQSPAIYTAWRVG